MVPIAATLRNDGSRRWRPDFSSRALRKLKRHPRTAQIFRRIRTTALIRFENRERVRYALGSGQMMVRNDEVEAEAASGFGGGEGTNAVSTLYDELHSGSRGLLDDVILHAVTVTNAMRDMEISRTAEEFYHCL